VLEVVVGAEPEIVVLQLGGGVDPAALVTAERPLLVVARDDVLPQLRADGLEQEAGVPDDRKVAQDRVPALDEIVTGDRGESGHRGATQQAARDGTPRRSPPGRRHARLG
jgi:hypothetical protein